MRTEGGGEWGGDVEVKRMIKYQKAPKTRRGVKLPPSSHVCDAAIFSLNLLSLHLASYVTVWTTAFVHIKYFLCVCVYSLVSTCVHSHIDT